MNKIFFTKEEYNNIPNNLRNINNLVITKYKNGYSMKEEGKEESYFYVNPIKGTDTNGKKKILQAFRSPLGAILSIVPCNNILNSVTGLVAGQTKLLAGASAIGLNCGFIVCLGGGALCLPKLWEKSTPADMRYGLDVKEIDESQINTTINLNLLNDIHKNQDDRSYQSFGSSAVDISEISSEEEVKPKFKFKFEEMSNKTTVNQPKRFQPNEARIVADF